MYHRVSAPQYEWGRKVLARAPLQANEIVMDAGCGTGRLTGELTAALHSGRVVGLDASENMLGTAREYLIPKFGERVQFVKAALPDVPFDNAFDGIFSTATFHWVLDHDALFRNLYLALRPGGWLCAQCGGGANLARAHGRAYRLAATSAYAPHFGRVRKTLLYADAESTAARLQRSGFTQVETNLEEAPTFFATGAEYREFVGTVILRNLLDEAADPAIRDKFLDEFTRQAGEEDPRYQLDYWRLNISARKPA